MAVTIDLAGVKEELIYSGTLDDNKLTRALEAGKALVEKYAPGAPEAIQNEAVGLFCQAVFDGFGSTFGDTQKFDPSRPFKNCGAQALLAPWKVIGAGSIDA